MHRLEWINEQAKLLFILVYKKVVTIKVKYESFINGCFLYLLISYSRDHDAFQGHQTAPFGNTPTIGYPLGSYPEKVI